MKIVHLVSKDNGGAARAAFRISAAQNLIGHESSVVVLHKEKNSDAHELIRTRYGWLLFKAYRKINELMMKKMNLSGFFYEPIVGLPISSSQLIQNADVINLHWVNDGMLTYSEIRKLSLTGKKIIWTMHDMYSFTAGCYYDKECGQYKEECGHCILAKKHIKKHIKHLYKKKKMIYDTANISFVGCSHWISKCASESALLKNHRVTTIYNPIDRAVFSPVDKEEARKAFNIVTKKKVIIFGAMSSDSDPRKGFAHLKDALRYLDPERYLLVIFGNDGATAIDKRYEIIEIGKITSDRKLACLYSAGDVFVAPSIQENLSNAVMESLACGTPVVAFNIGGMPDLIKPEYNGYLAKPYDSKDLARGIDRCAEANMTMNCVSYCEKYFDMKTIAKRYIEYYQGEREA